MNPDFLDDLIDFLPYPIASALALVGSEGGMDAGRARFEFMAEAGEAVARFLAIVGLCGCRELGVAGDVEGRPAFPADFVRNFRAPAFGAWIVFGREACRWLRERAPDGIAAAGAGFFFKKNSQAKTAAALESLCALRNKLEHGGLKPKHRADWAQLCGKTDELLEEILRGLDFLQDYELVLLDQAPAGAKRGAFFAVLPRVAAPPEGCALGGKERAVLLRDRAATRGLDLDPLLVLEQMPGKAPDLYFYNGRSASRGEPGVCYSACRQGGSYTCTIDETLAAVQRFEQL